MLSTGLHLASESSPASRRRQSNGDQRTRSATSSFAIDDLRRKGPPLGQCSRASVLVDRPCDDLAELHTAKELPAALRGTLPKRKARTVKLRLNITQRQYDQFATVLLANGARRPKRRRGLSGMEKALMRALTQ